MHLLHQQLRVANHVFIKKQRRIGMRWIARDTNTIGTTDDRIDGKPVNRRALLFGLFNHVAVGGVRRTTSTKNITVKNSKGEIEDKQETTVENIPYLNLLINNNGKLEIKELSNYHKESEGEVEE